MEVSGIRDREGLLAFTRAGGRPKYLFFRDRRTRRGEPGNVARLNLLGFALMEARAPAL